MTGCAGGVEDIKVLRQEFLKGSSDAGGAGGMIMGNGGEEEVVFLAGERDECVETRLDCGGQASDGISRGDGDEGVEEEGSPALLNFSLGVGPRETHTGLHLREVGSLPGHTGEGIRT